MNRQVTISVIVPVYNEDAGLKTALVALAAAGGWHEVLLVDASDDVRARQIVDDIAREHRAPASGLRCPVSVLRDSEKGRAAQMNRGAECAQGDALLFLHADTQLAAGAAGAIRSSLESGVAWGWFDVVLDDDSGLLWWVSRLMNLRARATRIATGDQSIFVRRETFESIGGYRQLALMEDIDLSKRLKAVGRSRPLPLVAITSARRWRTQGTLRTIVRMWWLRLQYWWGVPTEVLARQYAKRG